MTENNIFVYKLSPLPTSKKEEGMHTMGVEAGVCTAIGLLARSIWILMGGPVLMGSN